MTNPLVMDTLFDVGPVGAAGWPDRPRLLMSYAYADKLQAADFDAYETMDVIADSGAFTAYTLGTEIDHNAYLWWLQEHATMVRFAFSLDVIFNADASMANYRYGREQLGDSSVKLVPTWHFGSPVSYLHDYCQMTDYVAIGGAVVHSKTPTNLWRGCKFAHDIAAGYGTKLHGLGITGMKTMFGLPWASVDSSSWKIFGRIGSLPLAQLDGRVIPIAVGEGTDLVPEHHALAGVYGLDSEDMHVAGYGRAAVHGGSEGAILVRNTNRAATARSFMYAEAVHRLKAPEFRLYFSVIPGDKYDVANVVAGHTLGNPWLQYAADNQLTLNQPKEQP